MTIKNYDLFLWRHFGDNRDTIIGQKYAAYKRMMERRNETDPGRKNIHVESRRVGLSSEQLRATSLLTSHSFR